MTYYNADVRANRFRTRLPGYEVYDQHGRQLYNRFGGSVSDQYSDQVYHSVDGFVYNRYGGVVSDQVRTQFTPQTHRLENYAFRVVGPRWQNNNNNDRRNNEDLLSERFGELNATQTDRLENYTFRVVGPTWQNNNSDNRRNNSDLVSERFRELNVGESGDEEGVLVDFEAYEDVPVEATGVDVPEAVESFEEVKMSDLLYMNVKVCKYVKPTPIQRHAMPILLAGRDLMACAQTGSGKTAAFCFPIIDRVLKSGTVSCRGRVAKPQALILSPTRELACQIYDEATKFANRTGLKIAVVYGGAPIYEQFRAIEQGVDILVATPGRLDDMVGRGRVSLEMVNYLALDEADRMLDMGFEHQIRQIVEQTGMPPPEKRQTMFFSATFPEQIQKLASDFLSNYIFLSVGRVGSSTDLIEQRVVFVEDMDKRNQLIEILRAQDGKHVLTLVFVETKRSADALECWLLRNRLPATAIHGDKVQMERERALRSFKSGATPILVATDVASRGLHIPNVAHVINFDLPKGIEGYVHRIGRTGRAGRTGLATAFFNNKNRPLAKALVELMQDAKQEVPAWLNKYAKGSVYDGYGARRHGESRFGGCDFRRSSSGLGSSYHAGNTGDAVASTESSSKLVEVPTVPDNESTDNSGDDEACSTGTAHFGYGYEDIVATGWD